MMKEGVLVLIKAAMINHPSHAGVQEKACGALNNLASNSNNKKLIKNEGFVELIKKAIASHPTHQGVQFMGSNALKILS